MQAGFRSPEAPIIYRAIQLASMAGFPLIVAGVCALLARPLQSAVIYIILAFVVGFFLPRYFLGRMIRNRQRDLRWGLADALDLMVISVEAGLGLNAAMMKVASELKDVHSAIAMNSNWPISKSEWAANAMKRCATWRNVLVLTIFAVSSRC